MVSFSASHFTITKRDKLVKHKIQQHNCPFSITYIKSYKLAPTQGPKFQSTVTMLEKPCGYIKQKNTWLPTLTSTNWFAQVI